MYLTPFLSDVSFEILISQFFSLIRCQSCLLVDYPIVSKNFYF